MLEEKINKKREELNRSIEKNRDYDKTYKLSVELDDLIAEFYKKSLQKTKKNNKKKILYMI